MIELHGIFIGGKSYVTAESAYEAIEQARQAERAACAAWLRAQDETSWLNIGNALASSIERGDHLPCDSGRLPQGENPERSGGVECEASQSGHEVASPKKVSDSYLSHTSPNTDGGGG